MKCKIDRLLKHLKHMCLHQKLLFCIDTMSNVNEIVTGMGIRLIVTH